MKTTFFLGPVDFRKWLEKNHLTAKELLVGFHKKGSGKPSITWPESVDEALCFGSARRGKRPASRGWSSSSRRRLEGAAFDR